MSERDAVDPAAVRHVADLARIDLDDEAVEAYAEEFAEILAYFETLEAVPDTDDSAELTNVLRADEETPTLDRDALLRNVPESEDGFVKGPRVS